jgi:type IV secretory pathway TrbD component
MIYRATIHQSLTRPMLLAGAERAPALAEFSLAAVYTGTPSPQALCS